MISQNDLYDITYAFIVIRNNIKYGLNCEVLYNIGHVLKSKELEFEDNQIRKALASIKELDGEQWRYIYHNNVYIKQKYIKNKNIYKLLIKVCEESIITIQSRNYEKAYDLLDCIHCLPDIIADNNFIVPRSYWKNYVQHYRKKWDKTFLVNEQKLLCGKFLFL